MDCLSDYIGVRGGCGTTVPPSSLYVNDLPGISFRQISSLADTQQQTFAGVWADIQTRAIMRLKDDVRTELGKRYKINQILDSITIPKSLLNPLDPPNFNYAPLAPIDPLNSLPYSYVGIKVMLDYNVSDGYVNSRMMQIDLQDIYFYVEIALIGITIQVVVLDLDNGDTLFSKNVTTSGQSWQKVSINKHLSARNVFIGYKHDAVNNQIFPFTTNISEIRHEGNTCKFYVKGAQYSDFFQPVPLVEGNDGFTVSPVMSIHCDYANLICTNLDLFKRSYLYALGYETMLEQAYSDRLNEYSLVRRAQALENIERFMIEYSAALKNVVSGIDLGCDCCIDCGGTSKPYITEQTP